MQPGQDPDTLPAEGEVVQRLVEGHRDFLAFLQARVASPAVAEELLQQAYVRSLEKAEDLRDEESAVAWFYRLLRNALIDHYRHGAAESKALDRHGAEPRPPSELELRDAVCACMRTLVPTLKAEYAEMIQKVDLQESPVAEVAAGLGITVNNATVRLHRARQALKRQLSRSCGTCATHGCLDCSCG